MQDTKDKRSILVTGGFSGIGKAIVQFFSRKDFKVISADIIHQSPVPGVTPVKCDVTKAADISDLFTVTNRTIGCPDVLVCNAGQGIHEKLSEGDPEKWQQILLLNIMGSLRVIRAFLPSMIERGSGDIVFLSSVSSKSAYTSGAIYAASKAAIDMIAETLRLEVQPALRVTTIAPGIVNTEFFSNMIGSNHTPDSIGWGSIKPEEIADTVYYAISRPKGIALNYLTVRPAAQPF